MDSCSRVLKIFLEFSVSLYSRFSFLPFLNASIEGNVKKTAVERTREWSVVLWKIPSRTPLGQKGKQLHFTQAQLNRNKDFLRFRFWILPERPLPVPPDKGNEGSKRY